MLCVVFGGMCVGMYVLGCVYMFRRMCWGFLECAGATMGDGGVCRYMTKVPKYGNTVTRLRTLLPTRLRARERILRPLSSL